MGQQFGDPKAKYGRRHYPEKYTIKRKNASSSFLFFWLVKAQQNGSLAEQAKSNTHQLLNNVITSEKIYI